MDFEFTESQETFRRGLCAGLESELERRLRPGTSSRGITSKKPSRVSARPVAGN